jgi:hypothetical protein
LEDNIKMDLKELGFEDGWFKNLAQDRVHWRALVLTMLNLQLRLPESCVCVSYFYICRER